MMNPLSVSISDAQLRATPSTAAPPRSGSNFATPQVVRPTLLDDSALRDRRGGRREIHILIRVPPASLRSKRPQHRLWQRRCEIEETTYFGGH